MVKSYTPTSLDEACALLSEHGLTPYAGGTDLMIEAKEDAAYLFLHRVPELRGISADGGVVRIGAAVTFTELLESPLTPPLLREAVSHIAAPAIRNLGTIGGNLANGSAKADSALILWATGSALRIVSARGERTVPVKDFYLGRKKLDLRPDELIAEIIIPDCGDGWYYEKVGAREALAISRAAFAGVMDIRGGVIKKCSAAFGAVSDVVIFRPDIDAMLCGLTLSEARAKRGDYLAAYSDAIRPQSGRISAEYRKDVCMNLLTDFFDKFII